MAEKVGHGKLEWVLARARVLEGIVAGEIREHAVFRSRTVRHRSGQPGLLREAREGPPAAPGRFHRRAHQQAGTARSILSRAIGANHTTDGRFEVPLRHITATLSSR